jgi:hypothetical protein
MTTHRLTAIVAADVVAYGWLAKQGVAETVLYSREQ